MIDVMIPVKVESKMKDRDYVIRKKERKKERRKERKKERNREREREKSKTLPDS